MNLNLLRWIDKVFGPILAWLLFIAGLAVGRSRKLTPPIQPETIKKILILKFFGGGSILLASPIFSRVKETLPDARISIITLSENKEICSLLTPIDKVYFLDLKTPVSFFFKIF